MRCPQSEPSPSHKDRPISVREFVQPRVRITARFAFPRHATLGVRQLCQQSSAPFETGDHLGGALRSVSDGREPLQRGIYPPEHGLVEHGIPSVIAVIVIVVVNTRPGAGLASQ
ncbi:hypothetical protein CKAH01_02900 [Colletotrichum kahawae]|uniref:Uncharacterized protein n=1 Tax=Colletotrichum kahawae TaxID=34407 RepID=A0AAD9YX94_COLKA|nr:hypothetical protein CKAH01_02900 [Colletotrichum kahawae]